MTFCVEPVNEDVDACAEHHPRQVHGWAALDQGLVSSNHHEAVVDVGAIVVVVVVVDDHDVEGDLVKIAGDADV
jgi:hypothetical protein